ncbi:hypothetical protein [Mycobacterium colombiense]|uniref:hypothetical protein n=1 Tax=Mycobacterium colombiense TaxID=339268 RepID=UPI0004AE97CE|nr:hypothetical protein [Mycobacterium colombiense]
MPQLPTGGRDDAFTASHFAGRPGTVRDGAPSGPVKTLSILLALLMLCTATTFADVRG